jgi:hypothetical protein
MKRTGAFPCQRIIGCCPHDAISWTAGSLDKLPNGPAKVEFDKTTDGAGTN